jgi:hypothetical protein
LEIPTTKSNLWCDNLGAMYVSANDNSITKGTDKWDHREQKNHNSTQMTSQIYQHLSICL